MFKTIKTIMAMTAAATTLLITAQGFAAQPCNGSNDSCSWSCEGSTYKVTCNNPEGPDRCYLVNGGSSQEAKCGDFSPYNPARVVPNPMNTKKTKAKAKQERMKMQ